MKIAKIFGIDIELHFTFWIGLIIFAYAFSGNVFSQFSRLESMLLGLMAAILLYGSVLLHEFGHSLVAQRYGISIQKITLMIIGGMAILEEEAKTPWESFKIAISGPLVSLAIVIILFLLHFVFVGGSALYVLCEILVVINLVLAVFNLIPLFPLDGGRAFLQAPLRFFLKDGDRATIISADIGKFLSVGLMAVGFFTAQWMLVLISIFLFFTNSAHSAHLKDKRRKELENNDSKILEFNIKSAKEAIKKWESRLKEIQDNDKKDDNH